MAPPSVGPPHGVQRAPSSAPTTSCPASARGCQRCSSDAARSAIGVVACTRALSSRARSSTAPTSTSSAPATNRTMSRSSANPSNATAKPTSVADTASPAASTSGPRRWRATAPAITRGSNGSTQGESVPSAPAAKPRTHAPICGRRKLQGAREERADLGGVGAERRARTLALAVEGKERAAIRHVQLLERLLVTVVHDEHRHRLERRIRQELADDRLLLAARDAPRGVHELDDGLAGSLCGGEVGLRPGLHRRRRRGDDEHERGERDDEEVTNRVRMVPWAPRAAFSTPVSLISSPTPWLSDFPSSSDAR